MVDIYPWLKVYYKKLIADRNVNLQRKDGFANWAVVSLLGFLVIYGQFTSLGMPGLLRVAVLSMALALIIRFFVHSCLIYANIVKVNKIKLAIEQYWMSGEPDIGEIKLLIEKHDSFRWSAISLPRIIWGQLKAGFLVILIAPIAALFYELIFVIPTVSSTIIVGFKIEYILMFLLVLYIFYEIVLLLSNVELKQKQ